MDENLEARKAELRKTAMEKGKNGNATPKARAAQRELTYLNGGNYIRKSNHCHRKYLSDEYYDEG